MVCKYICWDVWNLIQLRKTVLSKTWRRVNLHVAWKNLIKPPLRTHVKVLNWVLGQLFYYLLLKIRFVHLFLSRGYVDWKTLNEFYFYISCMFSLIIAKQFWPKCLMFHINLLRLHSRWAKMKSFTLFVNFFCKNV